MVLKIDKPGRTIYNKKRKNPGWKSIFKDGRFQWIVSLVFIAELEDVIM